jgi:two-component system, chemotaxis family, chemotaxis protein CheY
MDITMPNLNGVEALKQIRQIDPNSKVIMITALGYEDKIKECIINGAVKFIVKPFKRDEAIEKIYNTLQKNFG